MRGSVAIKDGRVVVQDPPEGGTPATLIPKTGIRLLVNGRECDGTTPVRSTDEIVLEPQVHTTAATLNVTLSPDRLQAWVEAKPELRVTRKPVDQPPAADLVLESESVTTTGFPWTTAQVVEQLREQGVTYGILEDNITALLKSGTEGSCLAARGDPPTPPVDEEVVILFDTETKGKPAVKENGTVDFKDLGLFASVAAGTLLATKRKAVPGRDGTTVTGEPVPAAAPKQYVLRPGRHTEVSADGLAVTAKAGGRPTCERSGENYLIEVIPVLDHYGDVNLKTGNIRFAGDVKITGSVFEGMKVEADGRLLIAGSVSGAVVQSERGVVINGHAFSSEIRAGGRSAHLAKFLPPLNELISTYEETLNACLQLVDTAARAQKEVAVGQLFLLLVDRRFKHLPARIKKLRELIEGTERAKLWLPESLKKPVETLVRQVLTIEVVQLSDPGPLAEILKELAAARTELQELTGQRADVELGSVVNSMVEATGDVRIGTQGSYNSTINAGGEVRIAGSLKGGVVQARGNISVAAAGSPRGSVRSHIQTTRSHKVTLDLAYPGVTIRIENRQTTIESPLRNVTAALSTQQDRVKVTGVPAE